MGSRTISVGMAMLLASAGVLLAPWAEAQTRFGKPGLSPTPRPNVSTRSAVSLPSRGIAAPSSRVGSAHRTGSIALPSNRLGRTGASSSLPASRGIENLLGALGGYGNHGLGNSPWGYYDRHREAEAYADAYRDAAIANAVVDVVGILVSNSQARRIAEPTGHYVTQRRVVKEGHFETYTVWVPEAYDAQAGEWIEGHHQTRRRWVPEVYEETQVWVQDAVVVRR